MVVEDIQCEMRLTLANVTDKPQEANVSADGQTSILASDPINQFLVEW